MKAKITKRLLESLKPQPRLYTVRDSDLPGFTLRVQPTGQMSWYLDFRNEQGRRQSYRLGRYPGLEPEGARKLATKVAGKVAAGADVQAEKKAARLEAERARVSTLGSFITERYREWALTHIRRADPHLAGLEADFGAWFEKPLAGINVWLVESWRRGRIKDGIAHSSINRGLSRLRSLLKKALEWGVISTHPLQGLKDFRVDNKRVRYLSADEETRLRDALVERETKLRKARDRGNAWRRERGKPLRAARTEEFVKHLRPLVLVALNTGARRGELFSLRWGDLNLEEKNPTLAVRAATSKSGRGRQVPLNQEALAVLRAWRQQTGGAPDALVFPSEDGERLDNIAKAWGSVAAAAKLVDFNFHDLRHTFASRLVQRGVDLYAVSKLMGHATIAMSERYAHLGAENLRAAVAKLA